MLRKISLGLAALFLLVVLGAYLLPSTLRVHRMIEIAAPPGDVFAVVNRLDRLNEWSPWYALDPDAAYAVEGPKGGVGQRLSWQSAHEQVGTGSQEIVQSIPDQLVQTELDFGEMGGGSAAFELAAQGAGTQIVWRFETDLGMNPIARYMGLMMDDLIGTDYEKGLANLKKLIETGD